TQMRMPMNPQPESVMRRKGRTMLQSGGKPYNLGEPPFESPIGARGQRLCVGEAFRIRTIDARETLGLAPRYTAEIEYRTDGATVTRAIDALTYRRLEAAARVCGWASASGMPEWACRLQLYVCDVCIERFNDIRETDAIAEGVRYFADVPASASPAE